MNGISEKAKRLLYAVSDEVKQLVKRFPLTMGIIVFVTLMVTVLIDQYFSIDTQNRLDKIYAFCGIWAIGTFFTETYFMEKLKKVISYGVTAGISFCFVQILASKGIEEIEIVSRFLVVYLGVLLLISMYKIIKNANLKFEEYVLRVFRDLFHMNVTYLILNIGIMMVTAIFVQLILDGKYGSILIRLLSLLFGLFYVPAMLYSFSAISKKEVGSFVKSLVLYVLLPLIVIAIVIIYIYIAKIILFKNMPKNIIYRILASIFIVAFPVWNMAKNYSDDKKVLGKITKILPYFYSPFILLEIYSISVRIYSFGVTPMRYISCVFIVFQVICLFFTFYRKGEKISQIFLYASVILVIVLVTPLNYENVSNWSQRRMIEKKLPEGVSFEALSDEDKESVKGAYKYLKSESNGEEFIPKYLTDEEKAKIEEYKKEKRDDYSSSGYIYLDCELELAIEEYSKISQMEGRDTIIELENSEDKIDLNDKVQELIYEKEMNEIDLDEYFKENNMVKVSSTRDFYISYISIDYYKHSKEINYLRVEGYLLER